MVASIENLVLKGGECWHVEADIGTEAVDFLVDPGSMITALDTKTFDRLRKKRVGVMDLIPIAQKLKAANDTDMPVIGFCELKMSIQGYPVVLHAVVCELGCPGILGMDLLGAGQQGFPFKLNMRDGLLEGYDQDTIVLHRDNRPICHVQTRSAVRIPPLGETIIDVALQTHRGRKAPTIGLIEGLDSFSRTHKLLVGRCIVDTSKAECNVPVLLINPNGVTVTIPA